MIIYIDGPEKAGKTTLVRELSSLFRPSGWHVVHTMCRRPFEFDPWFYQDVMKLACRTDTLVILDRGWISEVVYNELLSRPHLVTPTDFEWCIGRAVRSLGCGFVLLESPQVLSERRDGTDLDVSVISEIDTFSVHAIKFGYPFIRGPLTDLNKDGITQAVVAAHGKMSRGFIPPHVAGPYNSMVAIVGERRNLNARTDVGGSWLPFTSQNTEWLRNVVPSQLMHDILWTNADDLEKHEVIRDAVRKAHVALAFGKWALRSLENAGHDHVIELPHPAAVVRWPKIKDKFPKQAYNDAIHNAFDVARASTKRR